MSARNRTPSNIFGYGLYPLIIVNFKMQTSGLHSLTELIFQKFNSPTYFNHVLFENPNQTIFDENNMSNKAIQKAIDGIWILLSSIRGCLFHRKS